MASLISSERYETKLKGFLKHGKLPYAIFYCLFQVTGGADTPVDWTIFSYDSFESI